MLLFYCIYCDHHHVLLPPPSIVNAASNSGSHNNTAVDRLDSTLLARNSDQVGPLQSWGPELRHFRASGLPADQWPCDIWFEKPVIITKIDAGARDCSVPKAVLNL